MGLAPARPVRWRRAAAADLDAARAFIAPRESYAASLSGRLLSESGALSLPARRGGFYLGSAGGPVEAAALLCPSGTALPLLDPADGRLDSAAGGLAASRAVRAWRPSACLGREADVEALEAALGWRPAIRLRYDAMFLDTGAVPPPASAPAGLELRRAVPSDLDGLAPLAEAYDREEVVTALHRFDPAACRLSQARSLARQTVWIVLDGERPVARAQTNARGWSREQLGGVFVFPEYRGRGLGRLVVSAIARDIAARGKGVSLFVKKGNAAARGLYRSMGFGAACDFRVDYFG